MIDKLLIRRIDKNFVVVFDVNDITDFGVIKANDRDDNDEYLLITSDFNGDPALVEKFDSEEAALKALDTICYAISRGVDYITLKPDGDKE